MSEASWTTFDFSGGMNMSRDPSRIEDNEYYCLINGRNRYSVLQSIKVPKDYANLIPAGKMQGCYGADNLLLVFVSGQAYVNNLLTNAGFFKINGCQMDPDVDYIYVELVPGSVKSYKRTASVNSSTNMDVSSGVVIRDLVITDPDNTSGGTNSTLLLVDFSTKTPRCAIVQDGLNRPMIIFPNGHCRAAYDFNDWQNIYDTSKDLREYIPVGKQMLYHDGILYIVSPDGREIYRSVSGRPMDFVIAIDSNGNKLVDGLTPEASRLSHTISYDPITCIKALNTSDGGFLVSTARTSFVVTPDYQNLIYGEPTFSNTSLFPVGTPNNFSVVDILGDTAITSSYGIHSFNAVLQLSNEGKNSPFSSKIYRLFEGIIQTITASIAFDNYVFFALDTIYGPAIVIYDTLTQKWVGIDMHSVGLVKMFAEIVLNGEHRLFFITDSGELFEYDAGDTTATRYLYTKEWSAVDNAEVEQKLIRTRVILQNITEAGVISCREFVDRKAQSLKTKSIAANCDTPVSPSTFPFGDNTRDTTYPVTFVSDYSSRGHKIGMYLSLDFNCDVTAIQAIVDVITTKASIEHQVAQYA